MIVERRRLGEFLLLRIDGPVAAGEETALLAELLDRELRSRTRRPILDLSRLEKLDEEALRVLASYLEACAELPTSPVIAGASDALRRRLRLARLQPEPRTYESLDAVLAAEGA